MSVVINNLDSGPGSLRDIIENAVDGDIITFDPSVSVITLTSGQLTIIDKSITINGGTGNNFVRITKNSPNTFRIFTIVSNTTKIININNLQIDNGNAYTLGGGISVILNLSSECNIDNCIIENNVSIIGAGIVIAAPSTSVSTCGINYCSINSNSTSSSNVVNTQAIGSGIAASTRSSNIIININNSLVNNNGNLLYNIFGAGIFSGINSVNIVNSTINGNNTSNRGGGIFFQAMGSPIGTLSLINNTITNNNANTNGGGLSYDTITTPMISIGNTILAENISPILNQSDIYSTNLFPPLTSLGNNFIGILSNPATYGFSTGNNDIYSTTIPINPQLNPLGYYGGVYTWNLCRTALASSPILEAGKNSLIISYPYDQRGAFFTRILNGTVDIGSVENIAICFLGSSKVLVKDIVTGDISECCVKDVYSNRHLVFNTETRIFVPIIHNIVASYTSNIRKIPKDSISENIPNEDFYITGGHKILVNNKIIKVRDLNVAKRVKINNQELYSLCTDIESFILVNNMAVMSWGYQNWKVYSNNNYINWYDNVAPDHQ